MKQFLSTLGGLFLALAVLGQGSTRTVDTVEQMTNMTLTASATGDKITVDVRGTTNSIYPGGVFSLVSTATNDVDFLTYFPGVVGRWVRLSHWFDGVGGGTNGSTVYVFGSEYPHLNLIDDPTIGEVMRVGIFGTTNLYSYIDWDQMTNHILAGANMTVTLVGDALVLESLGGAGGTNGTPVTVDGGTDLTRANFADSPELNPTIAGTNITYSIVPNSIATNKIDATFYTLLMQTNSGSSTGSVVRVNAGSTIPDASFDSSTYIAFANSGGSITATVVNGSLGTNKLDSQVYNLLIQTNGGGGTGDVVGPSGASNNAVAIYDSTTGKLIKNSRVTIEGETNLFVTGYASGLDAIQADQFVTLRQLQSAAGGDFVNYFHTELLASGFSLSGTNKSTNWMTTILASGASTNAAVQTTNGSYLAAFISTNTFTSLPSSLAQVEIYCFDNSAGAGDISAELYIINDVTGAEEYEFSPSPAYQTVPAGATPQLLTFSVPITDYFSTTNLHLMCKIKVQESSGTKPTLRIVSGGGYPSHVAINLLSSSFVLKSGDTMTGDLNVPDEVYGGGWNGSTEVPTKNAIYDKIETLGTGGTNVGSLLQVLGGAYLYLTNVSAGPTSAELAFNSMFGIVTNIIVTGGGTSDKAHITMSLSPGLTDTNYQVMFTSHGNQGDGIPVSSIEHTFQGTNEVRFVVAYSANSGAPNELKLNFWIVDYNASANITGGSGTGDVVGPSSSTDNAVTRFDGTTGKLLQDSNVRIQDDGSTVFWTNTTANPRITLYGTNPVAGNVQGAYLEMKQYATGQNNLVMGVISNNVNGDLTPNIRLQVDHYNPTNATPHIGLNVGGTANSSFVVKRQTAALGGNSYIGVRGSNMLANTDATEEFTLTMAAAGATLATGKSNIVIAPFGGVTQLQGTAAPTAPTTGEGLELWYDTDDTGLGGGGAAYLLSFDRSGGLWGGLRLQASNVVIRSGSTEALRINGQANVQILQTNYVSELEVTNGVTIGGTRRTTWPTVTAALLEVLPSVPASATNHVLDFGFSALTYSVTNNVNLLQSTNRPGNATNVLYSVMRFAGDTVDRTLSWHASWKRLGTNITTIPSNKVVVVSAMCIGTAETGVTFGIAKEE